MEHRIRRADGVYRWFQSRALPVLDKHGRLLEWYVLCTDIEERKRSKPSTRLDRPSAQRLAPDTFSQSRSGLSGKCAGGGVPSLSLESAIEPVAYPVLARRGSRCLPRRRCLADEPPSAASPAPGFDASSTADPPAARIALQS